MIKRTGILLSFKFLSFIFLVFVWQLSLLIVVAFNYSPAHFGGGVQLRNPAVAIVSSVALKGDLAAGDYS